MRGLLLLLACGAAWPIAAAEATPAPSASPPVLVILRTHHAAQELNAGLIGMLATKSVNKASARKVDHFKATLAAVDLPEQLRLAFTCFAAAAPCAGGHAFIDAAAFESALRASEAKEGYVVEVVPELGETQLLIRAAAYRMKVANDVAGTVIRTGTGYHALYTVRPPADIAPKKKAVNKANAAAVAAYWTGGEPRRINEATRLGLVELNSLFARLLQGTRDGLWADGQPVVTAKDFPDKKRLMCRGDALCAMTYVLEDRADGFVLVHGGTFAGWFDANAAAHESCLPAIATWGVH